MRKILTLIFSIYFLVTTSFVFAEKPPTVGYYDDPHSGKLIPSFNHFKYMTPKEMGKYLESGGKVNPKQKVLSAWKEYKQKVLSPWKEYKQKGLSAWKEYEQKVLSAWKKFEQKNRSAWEEYEQKKRSASKEFREKIRSIKSKLKLGQITRIEAVLQMIRARWDRYSKIREARGQAASKTNQAFQQFLQERDQALQEYYKQREEAYLEYCKEVNEEDLEKDLEMGREIFVPYFSRVLLRLPLPVLRLVRTEADQKMGRQIVLYFPRVPLPVLKLLKLKKLEYRKERNEADQELKEGEMGREWEEVVVIPVEVK